MANTPIGEALIEIEPDFSKFQKNLEKELKKALKTVEKDASTGFEIKVSTTSIERTLAKSVSSAIAKAERSGAVEIEVTPNVSNFASKVRGKLKTELDRVSSDAQIDVGVNVDTRSSQQAITKNLSSIADNVSSNLDVSFDTSSIKALAGSFSSIKPSVDKLVTSVDKLVLKLDSIGRSNEKLADTRSELDQLKNISSSLSTPFKNVVAIFNNVTEGVANARTAIDKIQEASQASGTGITKLVNAFKIFLGLGDTTTGSVKILNDTLTDTHQRIITLQKGTSTLTLTYDLLTKEIDLTSSALTSLNSALDPKSALTLQDALNKLGEKNSELVGDFLKVGDATGALSPIVSSADQATQALISTSDAAVTTASALDGVAASSAAVADVAAGVGGGSQLQLFNPDDVVTAEALNKKIADTTKLIQKMEASNAANTGDGAFFDTSKLQAKLDELLQASKELASKGLEKAKEGIDKIGLSAREAVGNIGSLARAQIEASKSLVKSADAELKIVDATKLVDISLTHQVNAWKDLSSIANKSVDSSIQKQKDLATEAQKTAAALMASGGAARVPGAGIKPPAAPEPSSAAPPPPPGAKPTSGGGGNADQIKADATALKELQKATGEAGDAALAHFAALQQERTGLSGLLDKATANVKASQEDAKALRDQAAALREAASQQGFFGGIVERTKALMLEFKARSLETAAGLKEIGAQAQTGGTGLIAFGVGVQRLRDKLDSLKQQSKDIKTALADVSGGPGAKLDLAKNLLGDSKGFLNKLNTFKTGIGELEGIGAKASFGIEGIGAATKSFLPALGSLGGGLGGVTGKLGEMAAATGPVGAAIAGSAAAAVVLGTTITKVADKITSFASIASDTGEAINAISVQLGATSNTFNGFDDALQRQRDGLKLTAKDLQDLQEPANAAAISFLKLADNAKNFGITTGQLTQAVTPIAAQLKGAGLGGEDLSNGIGQLTDRAIDLASVFNTDVNTVLGKFGAALRGETDPVESLGISFKALDVDLKAAELGFKKVGGEFSENAKQAARFALILEKSKQNTGDFAKTLGTSLPNQQRVFASTFASFKEQAAGAFLPAALAIAKVKLNLLQTFGPPLVALIKKGAVAAKIFADAFAFLGNVLQIVGKPFLGLFNDIFELFKSLKPVLEPIKVLLIGLAAVSFAPLVAFLLLSVNAARLFIKALTLLVNLIKDQLVREFTVLKVVAIAVFNALKPIGELAFSGLKAGLNAVVSLAKSLFNFIKPILPVLITIAAIGFAPLIAAIAAIVGVVKLVQANLERLKNGFANIGDGIATAFNFIRGIFKQIGDVAQASRDRAIEIFKGIGEAVLGIFNTIGDIAQAARDQFGEIFGGLGEILLAPFKFAAEQIGNLFGGVFDFVKGTIGKIIGAVSKIPGVGRLVKGLKDGLDDLGNFNPADLLKGGLDKAAGSAQFFKGKIDDLKGAFSGGKGAVRDFAKETEELQKVFDKTLQNANGLVSAQEALNSAREGEAAARQKVADIDKQIADLRAQQKAINSNNLELADKEADARDNIRSIENAIRDLIEDRQRSAEEEAIRQREVADDLESQADRRRLLQLDYEDAVKASDEAQKALNETVKAGVEAQTPSVNLAGLNLDQIRAKLANVRATLAAQKAGQKLDQTATDTGKTQAEKEADAERAAIAVRDAKRAQRDFEQEVGDKTRENAIAQVEYNEKVADLAVQQASLNRDLALARQQLAKDLADEFGRKTEIKKIDQQIADLNKNRAEAQKAITAAVQATAVAELNVQRAIALAKGDTAEVNRLDALILEKKGAQLDKNSLITAELNKQIDALRTQIGLQAQLVTEQKNAEARAKAIAALTEEVNRALAFERDNGQFTEAKNVQSGARASGEQKLEDFIKGLRPFAVLTGGRQGPVNLSDAFIRELSNKLIDSPSSDLIGLLRDLLKRAGIEVPGLAEGGLINGAPGAMGVLRRVGEYGRAEAILPLTKPARMADLLSMPQILNPVLAALPQINLSNASAPQLTSSPAPQLNVKRHSTAQFGTSVVSEQEKKKERLAMASAIADALVSAGFTGNTINVDASVAVTAPTDGLRDRRVAREIRKEIEKYL